MFTCDDVTLKSRAIADNSRGEKNRTKRACTWEYVVECNLRDKLYFCGLRILSMLVGFSRVYSASFISHFRNKCVFYIMHISRYQVIIFVRVQIIARIWAGVSRKVSHLRPTCDPRWTYICRKLKPVINLENTLSAAESQFVDNHTGCPRCTV